ncbi:flagellar motor switch phosphatase FliY [Halobacillus halophilus]|uniref:flagellar motor switch phosphatase FliY n=1 Tax=Halobacillus halophilus TaxID=1570 RepID=UPI001CD2A240|nr:flagellar motor switch phosphatase FliY [Halobacillus halophilus]MCA1009244.1 flagellar motor switch phosphatase FliY [Halobacillus halophilus]
MSDDMLSQDEIDALLNGSTGEDFKRSPSSQGSAEELSILEQDALGEIGNISFGSSATALSSLLNQKVQITTPKITVVNRNRLSDEFPKPYVAVGVTYTDGFSGENVLVINTKDAAIIADLMLGGDGSSPDDQLNEISLSAVQEAMNQMMGSAATSMSTIFNKKVDISPPTIDVLNLEEDRGTDQIPNDETLVKVSFQLKVGKLIDSSIMQLLPVGFARELVDQLMNPEEKEYHQKSLEKSSDLRGEEQPNKTVTTSDYHKGSSTSVPQDEVEPQYVGGPVGQNVNEANIQTAQFQNFESVQLNNSEQRNLDMLMDIPLKVTVELGRTKRTIKDILEISAGSVVELDKLAGEPVDILVNEKLMAKGEVVVIDENFGVRVTDIVSPKDRLSKLR